MSSSGSVPGEFADDRFSAVTPVPLVDAEQVDPDVAYAITHSLLSLEDELTPARLLPTGPVDQIIETDLARGPGLGEGVVSAQREATWVIAFTWKAR